MMSDASNNRFALILTVRLDRIARSMLNFYRLLERLTLCGVGLHCVDQPDVSTRTSTGRLMMNVVGAIAEYERELITERTIAGLERTKAQGTKLGRKQKPVDLEKLARMKREGRSVREIAKELNVSVGTVVNRSRNGVAKPTKENDSKTEIHKSTDL